MTKVTARRATTRNKRDSRSRRQRQRRVRSADVCFGTTVAAELVRIFDGATDPNPALVSLALTALDTPVFPFAEHNAALAAGKVVVFPIPDDERFALRDTLLTATLPAEPMLTALRRRLSHTK